MRITKLKVENFRGIKNGGLLIPSHAVMVGDNNIGKSSILEAIDLVLGPERLSRRPVIDEHDFYAGQYINNEGTPISINIEVVVSDLSEDQTRHFRDHIEWWDEEIQALLDGPPPEGTDKPSVKPALRVGFTGSYDAEEDDFIGSTRFMSPPKDDGSYDSFKTSDKRLCGFLYLRTLRTGSRALSLERGSLLDIILRLQKDKSFKIWEEILEQLRILPVADKPEFGISEILSSVQSAIRGFMPADSFSSPHMRVSDLTRDTLRKTLTVFMETGAKREDGTEYAAPFQHQGTGTINTLVLALLSLIADLRQNVIFAMEEPEIAIPPHTQKRIIDGVRKKSAQAIFTSHSPYVLEEFKPEQVLVLTRNNGILSAVPATYPPSVKPKGYKTEVRKRFCEALLSRRVLIAEGRTEYDAYPAAARRLHELHPEKFRSLEALGVAIIDAETDSQVALLGEHYKKLGKIVFAVFDQQSPEQRAAIQATIKYPYEAAEKGFENVLLNGTTEVAIRRYAASLIDDGEWPTHLISKTPTAAMPYPDLLASMRDFFKWAKGHGAAADFLLSCSQEEMPKFIVDTLIAIQTVIEPKNIEIGIEAMANIDPFSGSAT
ncbi:ATP-dependent endonuclease family protein [Hydrogenophaga taeniospiralis CCUG 15921]|uniref:ATP-dependent endonuclease family protein n=1 Tax=Hydrogenophaga taeniospiralis CCUG 15921 TaxID=1281780 RepID=A0A9X4NXK2_9BURK|nr:AAA family ATPase [Hydrogenophaga taeniospiralis]MDG5978114.1 ATP-dependent endonuclease family protein [Hydrogenophaga taeniospiralis CCUG 15921]